MVKCGANRREIEEFVVLCLSLEGATFFGINVVKRTQDSLPNAPLRLLMSRVSWIVRGVV